ncbi:hypothetical protein [Streptomyces sp. SID13031]|uniref:hypothetical protein n=1 Tax=Streptomyces sp. SID13031 TaxID=2706046 RepID=UPI0013C73432|nr:hypothetical protein [Streptomyces sp. SID13031]NEA36389.1 hypothetical protein [Streptomyces sp. SID13031]
MAAPRIGRCHPVQVSLLAALSAVAGAVLALPMGLRTAIWVAGALCLVSAFVLPWKSARPAPLPEPV